MQKHWDLILVGGGIGGLCSALFLQQAGLEVLVLERANSLNEVGAGLQLAPNALAALAELKVLDEVLGVGWKLQGIELKSSRSGLLSKVLIGERTLLAIHRARLQKTLAKSLKSPLRFGVTIKQIEQDPEGVRLELTTGELFSAKLLIGADGLRSQTRELLFPPVEFRYSGTSSYRGIAKGSGLIEDTSLTTEIWGPSCRLGYCCIYQDEVYWYLTFQAKPQEQKSPSERKIQALKLMENFPKERSLIERTELSDIIHTDIGDLKPTKNWVNGRVALLGDAAHATTPNLGQGAAQAIEDAWALALALQKHGLTHHALQAYQQARVSKALWIVQQSWRFQKICHMQNPILQNLRDALVRATPPWVQKNQMERIYNPEVF